LRNISRLNTIPPGVMPSVRWIVALEVCRAVASALSTNLAML
jgi:hypothetical protein